MKINKNKSIYHYLNFQLYCAVIHRFIHLIKISLHQSYTNPAITLSMFMLLYSSSCVIFFEWNRTAHVNNVVIHFCACVIFVSGSEYVQVFFYCFIQYICIIAGDPITKRRRVWFKLTGFHPAIYAMVFS